MNFINRVSYSIEWTRLRILFIYVDNVDWTVESTGDKMQFMSCLFREERVLCESMETTSESTVAQTLETYEQLMADLELYVRRFDPENSGVTREDIMKKNDVHGYL